MIEKSIDEGLLELENYFDYNYRLIPGFDPPKFHVSYDSYFDNYISVIDKFLYNNKILYAIGVDINGYVPIHNNRFNQPPTGDKKKDLRLNRTKRKFDDPVGIKAARNKEKFIIQDYLMDTGESVIDISSPIYVKGKHWGAFRIGIIN